MYNKPATPSVVGVPVPYYICYLLRDFSCRRPRTPQESRLFFFNIFSIIIISLY